MLIFSADGHIQKVTQGTPLSAVCGTTVSHSHRDSHQSQLATAVWVLLDLMGGWGVIPHSLAIYDRLSVRLLSDFPAGKPIEDFGWLGPKQPEKAVSSDDFFCSPPFSGRNWVLN